MLESLANLVGCNTIISCNVCEYSVLNFCSERVCVCVCVCERERERERKERESIRYDFLFCS